MSKSERSRYVERAIARALKDDAVQKMVKFLDDLPKSTVDINSTDTLRRIRLEADGRPLHILEGHDE